MSLSSNSTAFPFKDNNTCINNNNIVQHSQPNYASHINLYCTNHYKKKAKFFFRTEAGGISPFVCSKCALLKALEGIKIEKVFTNEGEKKGKIFFFFVCFYVIRKIKNNPKFPPSIF